MSIKINIIILFLSGVVSHKLSYGFHTTSQNTTDTIKTVAVYSSKKSFFPDYTLETFVDHLNQTNPNPGIKYYKNTEDRSKTGFYADYVVDIDFWVKQAVSTAPKWYKVQSTGSGRVKLADGTYSNRIENITTTQEVFVDGTEIPAQGEVRIKIIEKRKNEKVRTQTLSAFDNNEQDIKLTLIIKLITYLHQQILK